MGDRLRGVAVTPDGKAAYVLSYQTGTAIPISTAAGKPGAAIGLGGAGTFPTAIAITPDGKTAYVPATSYNGGTVIPISTATGTAGPPIRTGTDPLRHRDHPRGETAYVSNKARARSPRSIPPPTPQARRSPRGPAAAPSRSPPDRRHPQGRRGRHHPARTTHRPRNLRVPKACATWAKGPA